MPVDRDDGETPGGGPPSSVVSRWEPAPRDARARQEALRSRIDLRLPAGFRPRLVAGADVSASRGSAIVTGGFVVLDIDTLEEVDRSAVSMRATFPYVPGLLSFRELPVLEAAWARLGSRPDVIIFDGQGYAHPRRFGLACHGGLTFDVPSLGCAKSLLIGSHRDLGAGRGSVSPLDHAGETVGAALRTRDRVAPVYVSAGHRMDLSTAIEIVLRVTPRYRLPETTRRAHALVNAARRDAERQ